MLTEKDKATRIGRVSASIAGEVLCQRPEQLKKLESGTYSLDNADDFEQLQFEIMSEKIREMHNLPSNRFTDYVKDNILAYGNDNEMEAIKHYAKVEFPPVRLADIETGVPTKVSDGHPWLCATPDGIINGDTLLEIKCPYGMREADKNGDKQFKNISPDENWFGQLPHYYAQVQIQLFVFKKKLCKFCQWGAGIPMKIEEVEYDQHWINTNLPKLKSFHQQMQKISNDKMLAKPYLAQKEVDIVLDKHTLNLTREIKRLEANKKQADEMLNKVKQDLVNKIIQGDYNARSVVANGLRIKYYEGRRTIDYKRLIKDKGINLSSEYINYASGSFRVSQIKKNQNDGDLQ